MAELNIGPAILKISPELDNFVKLRRRYLILGEEHKQHFNKNYAEFKTADDLFESLPAYINKIYTEIAAAVADDLATNRIYDVSEKSIRTELESRAERYAINFDRIQDAYFKILGMSKELDAQREQAKNNRPQIVGGGFGVEGAAKGIAQATIANVAIGLVYGLANLTAKAASSLGDQQKKRELLNNPATKADISDFLMQIALQGCELVADTLNMGAEKPIFESVASDSREKSAAIVENVVAGRVPEEDVQSIVLQSLALNPFNHVAWTVWLDRFGDPDGTLIASAAVVGVTVVAAHKARLIYERKKALSWDTPEECWSNAAILEEYACWLGVPFDAERTWIESRATELDRRRRTFDSIVYPTEAEAASARQAKEDQLKRTVDGVIFETVEGANEVRERTRMRVISQSSASHFLGWFVLPYRRWREIKGRSCRKEFFMFLFFVLAIFVFAVKVIARQGVAEERSVVLMMLTLGFIFVSVVVVIPLQIRRFHDQDRPGFFVLLNLIPYVGWVIALAFMFVKGTSGDNKFGPSPVK